MSVSAEQMQKDQWLQRMLGVSFERAAEEPPKSAMRGAPNDGAKEIKKKVRFEKKPNALGLPTRCTNDIVIGSGKPRSGAVIAPQLAPKQTTVAGPKGELKIARKTDGRIVYTAPPPPVGEITFSGGGGKGTALPGAVKALHESGVLKNTKTITGASVGSMTAALVAAGITPDEFEAIADDANVTKKIKEGKNPLGAFIRYALTKSEKSSLTGKGLEDAVREVADETLRKRITEYVNSLGNAPADENVLEIFEKLANKKGPTFADYRKLSKVVPGIKEVVITGTFVEGSTMEDKGGTQVETDLGAARGQLYIFDADSEPDMEVALAVHASASFPGAFKPITIPLSNGITATFIDGGVMNNTPTSRSLNRDRELDPVPPQRGITFVFEDEGAAEDMKKGKVSPKQGYGARIIDSYIVGANNAAAEYAKNRSAAEKPSEIVVVPLTGTVTRKTLGIKRNVKVDMRDEVGGTLNFEPKMDARKMLRAKTEQATKDQIEADKKPKAREFASESQMFVSIPIDELKAMVQQGVAHADGALMFRDEVALQIGVLVSAAKASAGKPAEGLGRSEVGSALKKLDEIAGKNIDYQGYVARELNKRPELDQMLEAERRINRGRGDNKSPTIEAADAVAETLRARNVANNILRDNVYPKMKMENEQKRNKGAGIETLLIMEGMLRGARGYQDVNQAIDIGYRHFLNKSDRPPLKRGHKEFALAIDQRRMKESVI